MCAGTSRCSTSRCRGDRRVRDEWDRPPGCAVHNRPRGTRRETPVAECGRVSTKDFATASRAVKSAGCVDGLEESSPHNLEALFRIGWPPGRLDTPKDIFQARRRFSSTLAASLGIRGGNGCDDQRLWRGFGCLCQRLSKTHIGIKRAARQILERRTVGAQRRPIHRSG